MKIDVSHNLVSGLMEGVLVTLAVLSEARCGPAGLCGDPIVSHLRSYGAGKFENDKFTFRDEEPVLLI